MNGRDIHKIGNTSLQNGSRPNHDVGPDHGVLAGVPEFPAMHVVLRGCMRPPNVRLVRNIGERFKVGILFLIFVGAMRSEGIVSIDADFLSAFFGAAIQNTVGGFALLRSHDNAGTVVPLSL